jgi:hypothetical protein
MRKIATLRTLRFLSLLTLLLPLHALAGYVPVAVTGFTDDIVANGVGVATSSITADVDGANYAFMAADFNPLGATPGTFLPTNRTVYSVATSGVIFNLAPYNANNSLRLAGTSSGTLTFATPQSVSEVFLLGTSGSGASTFTATLTFTDASTQVISAVAMPDWYGGASFAVRGLGRVNTTNNVIENVVENPRLYEVKLTVSAANYGKQVASITIAKTNTTGGVINVMGVAANTVTNCAAPTAQPTALLITPAQTTAALAFNAAAPAADKYLIVRTPAGAALTATPANTTTYAAAATLGNGTVVYAGAATSFSDAALTPGTVYRYTVFAYNDLCSGGPVYNTASPLTATMQTGASSFANIPATGYTADVVADGTGSASSSITAGVDALYAFMASNFSPNGTTFPTTFMPTSGIVNSLVTAGVSFTLQPYTANNSLRLTATDTGSLFVTTPVAVSDLYLLATSGGAASTAVATINFTDNTSQTVNISIADWFNNTGFAIQGLGRVEITPNNIGNDPLNPRLYEIRMGIAASNYGKLVSSVKISKNTGTGILHIMGMAGAILSPCAAPASQPTGLTLASGVSTVNLAFTAASPNANRYLIVRTPAGAALSAAPVNGVTYTVSSSLGNGTVVGVQAGNTLSDAGLTSSTNYRYTIFAYNDICAGGPVYNTVSPLTDVISTVAGRTYTWTGAENFTFTNPANWNPARRNPDAADILQFNNGLTNAVYGVTTQTVGQIAVSNNTTVYLQSSAAVTLTLASDNLATTNELDIAAGSSLYLNGTALTSSSLTLAFSGAGGTANIAGTLENYSLVTYGGINVLNLTNAVATVTPTGTLTIGGTHTTAEITGNTVSNLIINGTLNYKYLSTVTPAIPVATYGPNSLVTITGFCMTTALGAPANIGQQVTNLTYDCKSQTATNAWAGAGPLNVSGNFTMVSTGTGGLGWSTTQGYNHQVGNFIQTGGLLNMNTGVAIATPTLNVSGNFTQSGGTFTSTGNSTGANSPTVNFNGTAAQTASFFNAAPVGPITYRISNPTGLTLTGTGTLTGSFAINTNGGIRISTLAATPLTTTLTLAYNATGSTLTYDAPGSLTATANVFPATGGPANLAVNTGGSANILSLPFSRTVSGTLTMTSGDINVAANTLTLGTSATAAGTLAYTAGFIRNTAGGSFVRWFGTTALPTTAGTGVGFYPMGYNGLSRSVALSFSTATALSTGGSIGVSHTNAPGFTNGLSVTDGAYTIDTRTNSSWTFTTSGVAASGTIGMQLTGTGLFSSGTPANLRAMKANAVAGTHVAGFGSTAQRSGLSISDLSVPHYIGAAAADITGVYIAINTGSWGTGTTWDVGSAPGAANQAFINPGVTVTSNAATNTALSLMVLPGGTLTIPAGGTVTLDSALNNNGTTTVNGGTLTVNGRAGVSGILNNGASTLNISSGTVNLGPANGGSMPFTQNGTLNVTGGALNISGNLATIASSVINQSGGNINVDGNAGGVAASSVACATPIVSLVNAANNFTGGTFTVVDPHACATGANTMVYNNAANIAASGTHVFRMGNGTSTDPGGQTPYNFSVNTSLTSTGKFAFYDLVINTGAATNSYFVQGASTMGVVHDLIVNNGGEFRNNATTQTTYVGNNLTANTGGTYSGLGTTAFANFANGVVAASTNTQTVSGGGTFRNAVSATPAAKFASLLINNTGGGVTFNIGDVPYSGALTFTLGRFFMGANTLIQNSGASVTGASQATGWVVGKFQKYTGTGTVNHQYPVGDANYYTPLTITGTAATTGNLVVNAITGDHPSLSSSLINPSRSVNRYWSVALNAGMTFSAAGANIVPTWNAADLDPGATPASFAAARFNTSTWTPSAVSGAGPTTITAAVPATTIDGDYAFGETCSPLAISTPPQSQTICAGSPVTFSVGVGGTAGVNYQWNKGGTPITGATGSTYTIPSTGVGDAGNYTVVLSSQCGGVTPITSAVATLTVNAPPVITTPPATQVICENSPVTFSVAATGTGITYQWQKGGTPIAGATSNSYTINSVTPADAGSYTVVVTGTAICGSTTSQAATLTVNPLPLTITAATTTTFCAGGSVVLNATPGYTYQWFLNTAPITGATSASYTATASGSYTVRVSSTTSSCTGVSNAIAVIANGAPPSTITPAGTAAYCTGGSVTLSGPTVAGLTYQWYLNGGPISGATSATLAANAVGSYTLIVSAGTGCSSTSPATVVSMNALPPAAATAASGTTICAGNAVTLNANPGTGLSYAWNLNSAPITPAATGASYSATTAGSYSVTVTDNATGCKNTSAAVAIAVSALPTATVTAGGPTTFCANDSVVLSANTGTGLSYVWNRNASPVTPAATNRQYPAKTTGSYTVTVTDNATGCQNTSAAIAVTTNPLPNVTLSAGGSLGICAGSSVSLSVPTATGQTYQWMQAGTNITGATGNSFTANSAGDYSVQVTITGTGCKATSAGAIVSVNPLPTAAVSVVGNTTACQGDTVWLNANTGSGLTYQWNRNSGAIAGATNASYPATTTGTYTVTVTNGNNCSTTSSATNVTVNPRPLASISYTTPVTFCEGGAVVLTAISPTGTSYQWNNNAVQMAGSTGNYYVASTSGSYTVTIRNSFGCTETSPSILVVVNPLPQPVITRTEFLLSTGSYDMYQWYLNSLPITGSTTQSHHVTQNGGYTVRVTDVNGCSNYAPVYFFNNVGLPQALTPEMISVFPNPAHDQVSITAPVKVNVLLRDVAGRAIRNVINASQVDLRELPEGVYQLVITDQQGHYLKTEKLLHTAR